MRAIIIEEQRFKEVRAAMEFDALKLINTSTPERLDVPREAWESAVREVHRSMNYTFVRWAQSHGASCT